MARYGGEFLAPRITTVAGYRLYDDPSGERLGFIARAKRLGLTLEDITGLVGLWDRDECAPVQARLAELVSTKLADTCHGIDELTAFAEQLDALQVQLQLPAHDGACSDDCACLVEPASIGAVGVHLGRKPTGDAVPIACTLQPAEVQDRVAAWARVLDRA